MSIVSTIVLILGSIFFLYACVGLFKPSIFDDKNKPDEKPSTRSTALSFMTVAFAIMMFGEWLAPETNPSKAIDSKTEVETKQTTQEPVSSANKEADLNKMITLHKETTNKWNKMSEVFAQVKNNMTAKKVDLYKAYESAENLLSVTQDIRSNTAKIELENEAANKHAAQYIDDLKSLAYIYKQIAEMVKSVANGDAQFKPSDHAELKKLLEHANYAELSAAASLISAYESLGIPTNKLDLKNGGLK